MRANLNKTTATAGRTIPQSNQTRSLLNTIREPNRGIQFTVDSSNAPTFTNVSTIGTDFQSVNSLPSYDQVMKDKETKY